MVPVLPVTQTRPAKLELFWRGVFVVAVFGIAGVLASGDVAAAPGANCNINTTPTPPVITVGGDVAFTGTVSGKNPITYAWTFAGGNPASSNQQSVTVSYANAGSFQATLNGTNDKGQACSASATVTVNPAGGNDAPVANDDAYSVEAGQTLNVAAPGVLGNDQDEDPGTLTAELQQDVAKGTLTLNANGSFSYTPNVPGPDSDSFTYLARDNAGQPSGIATVSIDITPASGTGEPVARGDSYATPVGTTLDVSATRLSGVLYNDFDPEGDPLTAALVTGPANGTLNFSADGSFTYTPDASLNDNDNDSFTYQAHDDQGNMSPITTVNIQILSKQIDFKITMNYELGMHCTGFEFAYCCVLPPYNSILAQIARPQAAGTPDSADDFPRLLQGDPDNGLDGLGRQTVLRDLELDDQNNFRKYILKYFHDAQPRREGQGKVQNSTLISDVEGNSLLYHNTRYDSAALNPDGSLKTGNYNGATNVVLGDGDFNDPTDNYANGWLNHFYIYADLEGSNPANTSLEANKIRLGVTGHVEYPANVGAALQPMGPTGSASPVVGGMETGAFDNRLTFSGDSGTVVFTQMKVLENLPVMLTSPNMWEALGLPLTPFEDTIDFFGDPGLVDEDSIRPYVAMKAQMYEASCDAQGNCTTGNAVVGSNGKPVIGFGTAPIDIPNCERCHSAPPGANNPNSPNNNPALYAVTQQETDFWNAYYGIVPGVDSDWYSRLKGAAINMMTAHDQQHGTSFTASYPGCIDSNNPSSDCGDTPQNTRLGAESVICQKCHADNVIAVVKSANTGGGALIPPISEAIHHNHRNQTEGGPIVFNDSHGRDGGCQGCHPAHRSDGVMDGYPITLGGNNFYADGDNRLASGGCFVGRDVHSNPMKDIDGAETPSHMNAVGQWLVSNVAQEVQGEWRGIWCTNCHTQLGQEMWRAEDCVDLINGDCNVNPRGAASLSGVASAIGVSLQQVESWLDPKVTNATDDTHRIWDPNVPDANVATIEVDGGGNPVVTTDRDGDISVNILSFCTTAACLADINDGDGQWEHKANDFIDIASNSGAAVPFSAATDGRDHWLSPGEPHCADCHAAPFVEQSGNINPYPPFNYPRKASLMRYSRGHQDMTCQGCHESIHGLYPVSPTIDTTSYAQAAALNHDGSHGPLKCGTCHQVDSSGIPTWMRGVTYNGQRIRSYDDAVAWAHTFTDNAPVLSSGGVCQNCHNDRSSNISETSGKWLRHAFVGRVGRQIQDKAEIEALGHVAGGLFVDNNDPQGLYNSVCASCHSLNGGPSGAIQNQIACNNTNWKLHLIQGRLSEKVWEFASETETGSTCGW